MAHFKPIEILSFPRKPHGQSAEGRYWKSYKNALLKQDQYSISNIASSSHFYGVTSGIKVRFFDYSNKPSFSLSRFSTKALGGDFRSDGELFVAGDAEGKANIFQVSRKALLRSYKHPEPCHALKFYDHTHIFTGCDDTIVRLWDITHKREIQSWNAHSDYVRSACVLGKLAVTGSVDFSVKLWDWDSGCVGEVNHQSPVSSVLALEDNFLMTAGHTSIKIWDVRVMKEMQGFSPHSKNVTCLALSSQNDTIISGGLDNYVKMFSKDFSVFHSIKYPSPVVSVSISPNNSHLIVGMIDGKLSVRQKKAIAYEIKNNIDEVDKLYLKQLENIQKDQSKDHRYFNRGMYAKPSVDDSQLLGDIKKKLKGHDRLLKEFRYKEVLDHCLEEDQAEVIVSVVHELVQRNALTDALKLREPQNLVPVIKWAANKVHNPKYASTLVGVIDILMDMYTPVMLLDQSVVEEFEELFEQLSKEVETQRESYELVGMIDSILE